MDIKLHPARIHLIAAAVLLAGGAIYVGLWLYSGESLSGPVSLRKPILFCLASGVTCISLAWIASVVKSWRGDAWLASAFSLAIVGEVGLICFQQWRGVPSHFNASTEFDAAVLLALKAFVTMMTLAIIVYAIRTLGTLRVEPDYALAARAGMFLLVASCLLGFLIEYQGEAIAATGGVPTTYGSAGVLKFPHGVPMHAIQILPLAAFILRCTGVALPLRTVAVRSLTAGIVGFTAFALMQTYSGRTRFDLTSLTVTFLVVSIVSCFAWVPCAIRKYNMRTGATDLYL